VFVHGPHDTEDGLGEDAVLLVFVNLGGFAGDVQLAVQVLDLEFLEGFGQSEHGVGQFLFDELLVRSGVEAGLTVSVSSIAAAVSTPIAAITVSGGGVTAEGDGVEEGDEASGESGGGDHVGGGGVEAESGGGGLPDSASAGLLLLVDGSGVGDGEQADAGDEKDGSELVHSD